VVRREGASSSESRRHRFCEHDKRPTFHAAFVAKPDRTRREQADASDLKTYAARAISDHPRSPLDVHRGDCIESHEINTHRRSVI
jgi:hypothetical protein